MTEQEENELLAEKLLGWSKVNQLLHPATCFRWITATLRENKDEFVLAEEAPGFKDWASAGLILEALDKLAIGVEVGNFGIARDKSRWYCDIESIGPPTTVADTGPLAVRAAALEYIKSR